MQTSETIIEIAKALIEFQSEVPVIFKGAKGHNYSYADLAQIIRVIQPFMKKCNLCYVQATSSDGQEVAVTTRIMHESGEWMEGHIAQNYADNKGFMSFQQAQGSCVTYLRRYGLSGMLGLVTDADLDGAVDAKAQKKYDDQEEIKALQVAIKDNMSVCNDEDILNKFRDDCNKNPKNTSVDHWSKLKLASDVLPREAPNA
jgi:hypothetical protein